MLVVQAFPLWEIISVSKINNKKRVNGFTLIELLVAATIIIVLSAIGLVSFTRAGVRARDGRRKGDIAQVRSALELYRSDHGVYPASTGTFSDLITTLNSGAYLSSGSIVDPKNDILHEYTYTSANANTTYTLTATLLENSSDPDCTIVQGACTYIMTNP